jgi:hypothetical protein
MSSSKIILKEELIMDAKTKGILGIIGVIGGVIAAAAGAYTVGKARGEYIAIGTNDDNSEEVHEDVLD